MTVLLISSFFVDIQGLVSSKACVAVTFVSQPEEIAVWFGAADVGGEEWAASYNVAPQTFQPVVRLNQDTGIREIALMRWGLIPYWSKDAKIAYSTLNAKAETVATAPAFREAFNRRQCLALAGAFYEWQKLDPKHKQPLAIALSIGEPYGFAEVWDGWKDPASRERLETFSIITTDSNQVVAPLHNRMPVIIERRNYARWLGGSNTAQPRLDLLRPFPAEQMVARKVDKAVGNVRNDAAQLLEPSAPEDCAGRDL
jgi:putative SOS response-associated peptidase YedK